METFSYWLFSGGSFEFDYCRHFYYCERVVMGTRMSAERKELEDMRRLNKREQDRVRKLARRNKNLANVRRAIDNTIDYRRFGK